MTDYELTNPIVPNSALSITEIIDHTVKRVNTLPIANCSHHVYSAFEYLPDQPLRRMDTKLRVKLTDTLAHDVYAGLLSEQALLLNHESMNSYISFTNSLDHWLTYSSPFRLIQVTDGQNLFTRSTDTLAEYIFCVVFAWNENRPQDSMVSVFNLHTNTHAVPYVVTKQLTNPDD